MSDIIEKEFPILVCWDSGGIVKSACATNTESIWGVIHEYTDGTDKAVTFSLILIFTVTTVGSETDADSLVAGGGAEDLMHMVVVRVLESSTPEGSDYHLCRKMLLHCIQYIYYYSSLDS